MTPDEVRLYIRGRVETFISEANATEGLPDAEPETIDGVTHALFVAADVLAQGSSSAVDLAEDDIYLAALAFEYGKKAGARSTRTP